MASRETALARFAADYFNGEHVAATKIAPFVASWLKDHILDEDMILVRYLHEAGE